MSDQDKSISSEGDSSKPAHEAQTTAKKTSAKATKKKATRKKATSKKATKKSTAKKSPAKKKATKKKTAAKKTTAKKAPASKKTTKKNVVKKKTTSKKASSKSSASTAAAREVEKQAVSNALQAAVSAGGDLMKPSSKPLPEEPVDPTVPLAKTSAEQPEDLAESGFSSPGLEPLADQAEAREVEKKAVNNAILAAVSASGSLLKSDTGGMPPPDAPSVPTGSEAAAGKLTTTTESAPSSPAASATPIAEPAYEKPVSRPQTAPPSTQHQTPPPVKGAVEPEKPQRPQHVPWHQGTLVRVLLIAACIAAVLLYAKLMVPDPQQAPRLAEPTRSTADNPVGLRPVPDAQMQLIREVFAPELSEQ